VRWLLLKDLQILRRSPLLVVLLLAYGGLVGALLGFAVQRDDIKPRVAFLNEVPKADFGVQVGTQQIDTSKYANRLFESVDPIRVKTRAAALAKVRNGDAIAAVIIPSDLTKRLQAMVNLAGTGAPPTVEVLYNDENPLKTQAVESRLKARLADANKAISDKLTEIAAGYLGILLHGGSFSLLGQHFTVLGLQRTNDVIQQTLRQLPRSSPQRADLESVSNFARLAIDNLDLSKPVLASIGEPLHVSRTVVAGKHVSANAFYIALAAAVTLMIIGLFLGGGMLALEREEHAYGRLVRGPVSRWELLGEKVLLGALAALAATMVELGVISLFDSLRWARIAAWVLALLVGGTAFGAVGTAFGALTRDVRATTLLAILVALPFAFLALIPSGIVATWVYDLVRIASATFPFKAALQAVNAGLNDADPGLPGPLLHLAILAAAYTVIARVGLRRFA
jgi:ABC-type transport system involved in cytochrome c biogenesis permease component